MLLRQSLAKTQKSSLYFLELSGTRHYAIHCVPLRPEEPPAWPVVTPLPMPEEN